MSDHASYVLDRLAQAAHVAGYETRRTGLRVRLTADCGRINHGSVGVSAEKGTTSWQSVPHRVSNRILCALYDLMGTAISESDR